MNKSQIITEFKHKMCHLFGYDATLKYVGSDKPAEVATIAKPFLLPRDFLNFAVDDSADLEKERNRVNCLGNCKRAIDSQVDELLRRLGFYPLAKKKGWNIPAKLDFISASGLIAPRILKSVNQSRNRLEHEFTSPSRTEVESALDIAALFVSYAELVRTPSLNWTFSGGLSVRYNYEEMAFNLYENEPVGDEEPPLFSIPYGEG